MAVSPTAETAPAAAAAPAVGTETMAGTAPAATPATAAGAAPAAKRPRLDHVDAMRPLKQAGVVTTHALLFFAPATAAVGASLMLLHVTREAFLFISSCMLTYSYYRMKTSDLRRFWHRRLVTVGLPYLTWTIIYFAIELPGSHDSGWAAAGHFGYLLLTGYYQLYYLVVMMQFYLVFPIFLVLLRKTEHRPWLVLGISLAVQLVYVSLMHWQVLPAALQGNHATREIMSYQFYLVGGSLAAFHYQRFDAWVRHHARSIVVCTVAFAGLAEAWYYLAADHVFSFLGSSSDPFQPIVVPYNIAVILAIYLVGVALVSPRRSKATVRAAHAGSDDSYAVYLAQVLMIDGLVAVGWGSFRSSMPWPLFIAISVAIVYLACCLLSGLAARTPLAQALAGRKREPWSTLLPYWARPGASTGWSWATAHLAGAFRPGWRRAGTSVPLGELAEPEG